MVYVMQTIDICLVDIVTFQLNVFVRALLFGFDENFYNIIEYPLKLYPLSSPPQKNKKKHIQIFSFS